MVLSSDTATNLRAGAKGPLVDRAFALVAATVIVAAAVISEPGGPREVIALVVAGAAYVASKFVASIPDELAALVPIVAVGVSLVPNGRLELGIFLVVIVVLDSAATARSIPRAIAVVAAALVMIGLAWGPGDANLAPLPWVAACAFTFALGLTVRRQRQLITELEAARRALADAAVADERRRIARELHDLAGHTLAATLLHVTGARHVLRRDLDEAEAALVEAEEVGRDGLDQVRAAVAALRTTELGTDPPLATPADLARLVGEYQRAGLEIDDHVAVEITSVNGPTGTAIHRIAGEALTNVARHAPENRVELRIEIASDDGDGDDGDGDVVKLVVADHGRRPPTRRPGGYGLIGMEERARGLGGTLEAGPTPDGWRVEAEIPLPNGSS